MLILLFSPFPAIANILIFFVFFDFAKVVAVSHTLRMNNVFDRSISDFLLFSMVHLQPFYDTVIISREHLKRSILSRVLCLFCNNNSSHLLNQVNCDCFKSTKEVLCLYKESNCSVALSNYLQ